MTPDEFNKIGALVAELWPLAALNAEQIKVWRETLAHMPYDRAHKAISIAYSRSTWREPQLGSVTQAIQELRKVDAPVPTPEVSEEKRAAVYAADRKAKEEYAKKLGIALAPAGTVRADDLNVKKGGKK